MARTKTKNRSYKNATNPQAENSLEAENWRVETPVQDVPDGSLPLEDEYFPVPLTRPPPKSEKPPDPPLNQDSHSSSSEDESDSPSPAVIRSISATSGHTFPHNDQASTISPGSPVNLSRYSPTPGCSWDTNPVRRPRPSSRFITEGTCDVPRAPRSPSPILAVPGCSRDIYPRPSTSSSVIDAYMSPSSPVNLSWNSPIPGCSRDSGIQPRPSTSTADIDRISRMSLSPPLGQNWDTVKDDSRQVNTAPSRPTTPEMLPPVPVDELFSPKTQSQIRSSIQELFPNGPPPLPPVVPVRRPKKSDVPYIVGCTKRPRVPSPTNLTVFKGDKYGITSETNCDEEKCSSAKRGRSRGTRSCVANLSKSRFNAQSDNIATRLKLHEKIDTLLGRGDEPVEYVTKKGKPARKFSPLPSTSRDSDTIMKNDRQFSDSLRRSSDLEDEDEDDDLPEIVWGTTSKYERNRGSRNVSPLDLNDNTQAQDSQSDDTIPLVINEDANNNNDSSTDFDYGEIQFDKYIPKEKLIVSTDVEVVSVKPAEEPKLVEIIDLKDGYVYRPPRTIPETTSNDVICIDDFSSMCPNESPNNANGNVINLLNAETAYVVTPMLGTINKMPKPIPTADTDLVIEVPEAEPTNSISQSLVNANGYQDVQFIGETRSDESSSSTEAVTRENIMDVQIISCDGSTENGRNRPRNCDMLTKLQSWFSMLSDSCESPQLSSSRLRKRRSREPPNCENTAPINTKPPPETRAPPPAPTGEPANGKKLGECPICLDSLSGSCLASTNCGHVFCLDCIKKSLSTSGKRCPTCRKQLKGVGYHQVFL